MRRALVTGGSGFVGRWLCAALVRDGWNVTATATAFPATARLEGPQPWGSLEGVRWLAGDIRDALHVKTAVAESRPDAVVHLAAISQVQHASEDADVAWSVNLGAPVRLLSALSAERKLGVIDPVILLVGSAEQYGRQPAECMPLEETVEQRPLSLYGATKAAQELAGLQLFRSTGLRVIPVRPFPHSGAGQEPRFVIPALIDRALKLKASASGAPMTVGNTSPVRDFLHVSDVIAAYIALIERGQPGRAYNIASGIGRSVKEVAEHVLERVGVTAALAEDAALVRPVDVPVLVGDATRLANDTGWQASQSFDSIIDDLLHDIQTHAATH